MSGGASDGIATFVSPKPLGGWWGIVRLRWRWCCPLPAHFLEILNHRGSCPCHIVIIILQPSRWRLNGLAS